MDKLIIGIIITIVMSATLGISARRYAHKYFEAANLYLAVFVLICVSFLALTHFFTEFLWILLATGIFMISFALCKVRKHLNLAKQQHRSLGYNPLIVRYRKWCCIVLAVIIVIAILDALILRFV